MATIWRPEIRDDLEEHVLFLYPWGKKGTPLERFKGPRQWHVGGLRDISKHIKQNINRLDLGMTPEVWRESTVSGRGVGKTALAAWLILWMQSTRLGSTTIVTANTEAQLTSRTWPELGKWHTLALNSHWFIRAATTLRPSPWFEQAIRADLGIDTGYYYAQAQLWSEENPDAFAGAHNSYGMQVIFDEASGIPKNIWTTTEGFFTEIIPDRYWHVFSNGRRNTGEFYETHHKYRHLWVTRNIDSRFVEGVDPAICQRIIDKYGKDSDEARVEVYGQFPIRGENQLIGRDIIDDARLRTIEPDPCEPLIMGVDVGRGGDPTVIRWRQGRDARSIPRITTKLRDDMKTAHLVAAWINKTNPDAINIDAGAGTGVIDRLRSLGYKVNEIWFNSASPVEAYANLRTWMWFELRDWLSGGCIDDVEELRDDLAGPEKTYHKSQDKILLESKEDMQKRGLSSPNEGDALALTFAVKVPRKDRLHSANSREPIIAEGVDSDPF